MAAKRESSITEDIKPAWLNPIRAAQAACRDNRGYAILTMVLLVNKKEVVAWKEPEVTKIHPARLAEKLNVTPAALGVLLELGAENMDDKSPG